MKTLRNLIRPIANNLNEALFLYRQLFSVAAGDGFSIFVTSSGIVMTCGIGKNGCLGHGDLSNVSSPKVIGNDIHAYYLDSYAISRYIIYTNNQSLG